MGRKKITPDAAVVEATMRVINRMGPVRLTLADVAAEAGLSPATLLQRFGSKRGLLLAVAETSVHRADECFERARARYGSPLKALSATLDEIAQLASTPEALANNLAFLQIDLTDPDFYRVALKDAKATIAGYKALLDDAVEAGEIAKCNVARLARAVWAMAGGSLLGWAILREGSVNKFLSRDVEVLLEPLKVSKRPARRRSKSRRAS
jgi:AcrR family transcriptional regulator